MTITTLKELGNIEFSNCFLAMYFRKFGFSENQFSYGHYATEYEKFSKKYIDYYLKRIEFDELYQFFLSEAIDRSLNKKFLLENAEIKDFIYDDEFYEWQLYIKNNPTYIREARDTNYLGDRDITNEFNFLILDRSVRKSCRTLMEKGYYTYWSSANYEDFRSRKGLVIQNKSVAYILIDPQNLNDELKEKLYLNGECTFGGITEAHSDNGKYYGIWSEITSENMSCLDLEEKLLNKALELPKLENKQSKRM